ncbi:hypothetical protein [Sphingomonas solaris]|uniref:Uncharacterized protein n=1 Tax=Alterirhizorhabdus solaris TaxID=2529389 RepID=A0A558RCL1_9SPHN|nr:hypothetical protein [Sphingomonas solaris]TVV77217.1 hypothetical protein FOY91_01375 [Sphingomonas solaris]
MSLMGDAMRTIESVVLLRGKVERLNEELARTNDDVRQIARMIIQIDRRLIRLETIEEVRGGLSPLARIEG